jgi:hypothetical protein
MAVLTLWWWSSTHLNRSPAATRLPHILGVAFSVTDRFFRFEDGEVLFEERQPLFECV